MFDEGMMLNPDAVAKLKAVTGNYSWPYITHAQRNELARVFIQEAGRLLNQEAESRVKHAVECHSKGELSYEEYMELIEQISCEEEARGATYGGTYARNRVFDFAQKVLDREKKRIYDLSLADARKQFEQEKQKTK
jgi:hypothetical protein